MAINVGVNVSKFNAYATLAPNPGVNVSKVNVYAVLGPNPGVNVSKVNVYAALYPGNLNPPSWGITSMPSGSVGVAYSVSWDMPYAAPVTYTITSGSLPPGLSMTALTGNQAEITGTPTTAGSYSFTITATNVNGSAAQPFTIVISASGGGSVSNYAVFS